MRQEGGFGIPRVSEARESKGSRKDRNGPTDVTTIKLKLQTLAPSAPSFGRPALRSPMQTLSIINAGLTGKVGRRGGTTEKD
jgi:hypothetical protein